MSKTIFQDVNRPAVMPPEMPAITSWQPYQGTEPIAANLHGKAQPELQMRVKNTEISCLGESCL
jgi:hypothetical protein